MRMSCVFHVHVYATDYTKMMELVDDFGHKVFETISITLVCGTIVATTH